MKLYRYLFFIIIAFSAPLLGALTTEQQRAVNLVSTNNTQEFIAFLHAQPSFSVNFLINEHDQKTLLHEAIIHGNPIIIQLLINAGANIDAQDRDGNTPLHIAALQKNNKAIQLLISNGADLNALNERGETPKQLINKTSDKTAEKTQVPKSREYSREDILQALKLPDHAADYQILGVFPEATLQEITKAYHALAGKWHPDKHADNPPLANEVFKEINTAYNTLKDRLTNQLQQQAVNLVLARNTDGLRELLQTNPKFNVNFVAGQYDKNTLLHLAAEQDDLPTAQLLIDAKADVDTQDRSGNTPLHIAILKNNDKLMQLFINNGADLNITNKRGETPKQFIEELQQRKAAEQEDKLTKQLQNQAINLASHLDVEGLKALLQANPEFDINFIADADHNLYLLHLVAMQSALPIAEVLIAAGADINVKDKLGRTPLDFAKKGYNYKLMQLLGLQEKKAEQPKEPKKPKKWWKIF